jgi:hypothetical protein
MRRHVVDRSGIGRAACVVTAQAHVDDLRRMGVDDQVGGLQQRRWHGESGRPVHRGNHIRGAAATFAKRARRHDAHVETGAGDALCIVGTGADETCDPRAMP